MRRNIFGNQSIFGAGVYGKLNGHHIGQNEYFAHIHDIFTGKVGDKKYGYRLFWNICAKGSSPSEWFPAL